jgi:bacterioferritin B
VDGVRNQFDRPRDALALALDQERAVTDQVGRLAAAARDEGDYLGEQFMQWFLQEQVEEVALMTTLLRVADRAGANLFDLENFVAREVGSAPAGIGAPHAAGGSLSAN